MGPPTQTRTLTKSYFDTLAFTDDDKEEEEEEEEEAFDDVGDVEDVELSDSND
jgi:hypothetical protein